MNKQPIILTITGSDGTGASGLQADTRFITDLGGVAASVVTSITIQNTLGIQEFFDLPAHIVRHQMEAIINDLQPQVVKVGLLRRIDIVQAVADELRKHRPQHIIYAPIRQSTRGDQLVPAEVYEAIEHELLPLCTLVLDATETTAQPHQHGYSNQLSSAVAVFLSQGESPDQALLHARSHLSLLPADYADQSSRSGELYNQFLEAVARYCHMYADVSFYAEQLNVSARYLGQVTRRITGRSPKNIIDERIVADIVTELTTTNLSIKEIASKLGFSSQAHLSRYFKKWKGTSPLEYKNKHK